MRYYALAADYDGTMASGGRVAEHVTAALRRVRSSGRRLILVTGRRLDDLQSMFPEIDIFDSVVAENGGVLYWPDTRSIETLGAPPPAEFIDALRARGVDPLATGRVIVATRHPHEHAIVDVIHDHALELQVVFNEDEVMVLPPRISKGSGLEAALARLGLSRHEIVAVGNAANDHSFLDISECSVAVANAAPAVRAAVTFSTRAPNGDGVVELIDELVATDLAARSPKGAAETLALGIDDAGNAVRLSPYGHNILIVGPSASGKSTFATGLIERLMDLGYQLCIIDPEGDYGTVEGTTVLGARERAPQIEEVINVLREPATSVVVNLLAIALDDRPHFAADLLSQIHAMRVRSGRPHWVVIDEVHHLLPSSWAQARMLLPQRLGETILITMRASDVVSHLVRLMDIVVAVGPSPSATFADVAATLDVPPPKLPASRDGDRRSSVWFVARDREARRIAAIPGRSERRRHVRKYAEGDLGGRSFFFRGPRELLNLRAQNLGSFCSILMGVDDETFLHHLDRGDYETWLRTTIGDRELADEVRSVRESRRTTAGKRHAIVDAIDRRYVIGR